MPIREDNQNPLELLAEMSGGSGRKHSVPQNVMDVEFKVVGDITLRQLGFLCLGGVFGYIFYNSGLPSFWALILAGFSVIISAQAQASSIILEPKVVVVRVGETFTLQVVIDPLGSSQYTTRFSITFPPDRLEVTSFVFGNNWAG